MYDKREASGIFVLAAIILIVWGWVRLEDRIEQMGYSERMAAITAPWEPIKEWDCAEITGASVGSVVVNCTPTGLKKRKK